MPQVAKRAAYNFILNSLGGLGQGQVIRIENHKNDRFLEIKRNGEKVEIKEDGYSSTIYSLDEAEVKSIIGKLIEYEFPRSHKLRIKVRKSIENGNLVISPWSARKIQ